MPTFQLLNVPYLAVGDVARLLGIAVDRLYLVAKPALRQCPPVHFTANVAITDKDNASGIHALLAHPAQRRIDSQSMNEQKHRAGSEPVDHPQPRQLRLQVYQVAEEHAARHDEAPCQYQLDKHRAHGTAAPGGLELESGEEVKHHSSADIHHHRMDRGQLVEEFIEVEESCRMRGNHDNKRIQQAL